MGPEPGEARRSPVSPSRGPCGRTYTIAKGDSLSKIAKHFYGDARQWTRIFDANKDAIKNPDLIYPGQVIKIPDA